jgi:DNA-binding MarR family transcriptional regulator
VRPESGSDRAARERALGIGELSDVQAMRAVTHPVRLALLTALAEEGSLTATSAGELIGETFTTCSFHLRQLAKYGFVEEVPGIRGRSRPWKLTHRGVRFSTTGQPDPQARIAAVALARLVRDQQLARLETWTQTRDAYPPAWQDAASAVQMSVYLTPAELAQLQAEVLALFLPRFQDRIDDPARRPEGSAPVEALFFAYPTRLPDTGPPAAQGQPDR